MRYTIPLALLQLIHNRSRFAVTIAGVAFAVILMFMQLGFQEALYEDATTIHRSLKADLILLSPKSVAFFSTSSFPLRRLYDAMEIPGVNYASPFYIGWGQWKNPQTASSRDISFLAFNPDKPAFNLPGVAQNLNTIRRSGVVLFDSLSRPEYGSVAEQLARGQSVSTEINGRSVRVEGSFALGGGVMSADGLLISNDLNFQRITGRSLSKIDLGLITLKQNASPHQIKLIMRENLPQDVRIMTKQEFIDFEQNYWKNSSPIGFIFSVGTAMGFFIGAVIVYQILYTDVTNHLVEYATLKAMGYANIYFIKVVLEEALLLATLGFIPGLIISIILYDVTKNAARLPMSTNFEQIIFIFGLTIIMCAVSGAIAVSKLNDADPADIF
ncbi:MAG: ABC transporter permease DevC [Cyanobacteria bacterium P01_A01_bin.40]